MCVFVDMYVGFNPTFYLHQRGRSLLASTHAHKKYSIHLKNTYCGPQLEQPE